MITKDGENGAADQRGEHLVDGCLSVLCISLTKLILRIVSHQITSIEGPRQRRIARCLIEEPSSFLNPPTLTNR